LETAILNAYICGLAKVLDLVMAKLPTISKMKFGIIDADYMNTVSNAVNDYDSQKDSIAKMLSYIQKQKPEQLLVEILVEIAWQHVNIIRYAGLVSEEVTVAWKYKIGTVFLQSSQVPVVDYFDDNDNLLLTTDDFETSYGSGTYAGYCYNLAELSNERTFANHNKIFGVDVSGEAYPAGFTPQSAGTGSVVLANRYICPNGGMIFLFDRQGTHDGECT